MKFTQIPADTFKQIVLNAGILLKSFTPDTGTFSASDIVGATTGGITFEATPTFSDFGEDIDNCPKNTMELKKLDSWEVKMSGTYVTLTAEIAKSVISAADISNIKITPRNDIDLADFSDLWFVADYSNLNGETNGGFCAIHLLNALSTSGLKIQSSDKAKGQFAFEYTAHYSISKPDIVPFEVYIKAGTEEAA